MAITDVLVTVEGEGTYARLEAVGGTAPFTWTAYPAGQDAYQVPLTAADASGRVTLDGLVPFGVKTVWQVRDSTGATFDSDAHTVPGHFSGYPVLADATDPSVYVAAVVVDQLANEWDGRSVWFDILDRRDPFVALAPLRLRNGTLTLYRRGSQDRRALLSLLSTGHPLTFRTTCPDTLDDVVALVSHVTEELADDTAKAGGRLFHLDYQAVTRDLGPYAADPDRTWSDAAADAASPTWAAVVAGFATWQTYTAGVRA